jgi:hypothetical protein
MRSLRFTRDDTAILRTSVQVIVLAFIAGICTSWPLWNETRLFPTAPALPLPQLPLAVSSILPFIFIFLLLLLAIFPLHKNILLLTFSFTTLLALYDQNRWQPWLYQYFLVFFLLLFYKRSNERTLLSAFRLIVCGIYFWSGIQKLNPDYRGDTAYWLTQPLGNYFGNGFALFAGHCAQAVPYFEIFAAFGLLIPRTRFATRAIVITMHVYIILLSSPLGRNYNYVIVPWNIAMICLLLLLFRKENSTSLSSVFRTAGRSYVLPVFVLVWVFPALSIFSYWDTYLSSSLYSGNFDSAYLYVSKNVRDKLPEALKKKVYTQQGREGDTLYYFFINEWGMQEMSVPAYPETRVFRAVKNEVMKYASNPNDVILVVLRKWTPGHKEYYENVE